MILLDTHAVLWWLLDSRRLSARAREVFEDGGTPLLWSAASTWELAIKVALGKLDLGEPPRSWVPRILLEQSLTPLHIEHAHAIEVGELPPLHRDPFDRLLVAQARAERVPLLTADPQLHDYDVDIIW